MTALFPTCMALLVLAVPLAYACRWVRDVYRAARHWRRMVEVCGSEDAALTCVAVLRADANRGTWHHVGTPVWDVGDVRGEGLRLH